MKLEKTTKLKVLFSFYSFDCFFFAVCRPNANTIVYNNGKNLWHILIQKHTCSNKNQKNV